MDIARAFPLEVPRLDVPWGLTEQAFLDLVRQYRPQKITNGHYEMRCKFFGLPESPVHFHFEPRTNGRLSQIEFFRKPNVRGRRGSTSCSARSRSISVHRHNVTRPVGMTYSPRTGRSARSRSRMSTTIMGPTTRRSYSRRARPNKRLKLTARVD